MGLMDLINQQRKQEKKIDSTVVTENSIPTGFLPLDYANGVRVTAYDEKDKPVSEVDVIGLVGGTKTTVIGISGTGKSALAISMAASGVYQFGDMSGVQHADIESATTMQRPLKILKLAPSMLKKTYTIYRDMAAEDIVDQFKTHCVLKVNNSKDFTYNTGIRDLYNNEIYELYPSAMLIDSFALFKSKEVDMGVKKIEDVTNNMQAAQAAKFNKGVLTQMIRYGKKANVSIISVNHINVNVNTGFLPKASQHMYLSQDETMPGGQATLFLANNLLKLKLIKKYPAEKPDKMDYGVPGFLIEGRFLKSRTNAANVPFELVFDHRFGGFSKTLTLLHYAFKNNIVLGSGHGYYFPGNSSRKFKKAEWEDAIRNDKDFLEAMYEACLPSLQSMLSTDYGKNQDESSSARLDAMYSAIEEHQRDVEEYAAKGWIEF